MVESAPGTGGGQARLSRPLPGAPAAGAGWTCRSRTASTGLLQNLIIAVFALEQQLGWYDRGGKMDIGSVQAVTDQLELRHPPLPTDPEWQEAIKRARPMFGKPMPEWLIPATLVEFAASVRSEAGQFAVPAAELAEVLARHALVLGIDPAARTGRLATARRVAKLLREIAAEPDDVVVVRMVAEAEVGEIGDNAAGTAFKQATAVTRSLAGTQWTLLEAIGIRATTDERAKVILDGLNVVAVADQSVHDLGAALDLAVKRAAALLAADVAVVASRSAAGPIGGGHCRTLATVDELPALMATIERELTGGHAVTVSWEVVP